MVRVTEGGQDSDITLTNAYRVPQLEENLLSVAAVDRAGGAVIFMGGKCYVYQAAADIEAAGLTEHAGAVGTLSPKWQYMLGRFSNKEEKANTVSAPVKGTAVLHHRRYQHLGYDNLRRLPGMVKGNDANYLKLEREAGSVCRPCAEGKLTRARFAPSNTAADLMKVVHSDVCGPFPLSIGEAWYFITLYEKKTGLIMAVPMARKSDVGMGLRTNIPTQERLGGKRCQRLRTDGAREYKTSRLLEWYADKGITREETPPYNPERNAAAERFNRPIRERARAALAEAKASDALWAEAVAASVYIIKRSPRTGQDVTPWEALTGKRPDVSNLRVWGSRAYALMPAKKQERLEPKTDVGVMVGYGRSGEAYRIYMPDAKQFVERRDVVMDETSVERQTKDGHVHWWEEL